MKHIPILTLAIVMLVAATIPFSSHGQGLMDGEDKITFQSMTVTVGNDLLFLSAAPYRIIKDHPLKLAAFAGITTGLILYGDPYFDRIYGIEDRRILPNNISLMPGRLYDDIGPAKVVFGLAGSSLAGGLIFKDRKLLETSRLMLESILFTRTVTVLGKTVFGRHRPYSANHSANFELLEGYESHTLRSMPSLHTSSIFASATVIAKQYPHPLIQLGSYGLATSVALQRTASRDHWLSDVILGGALGYFVGSGLVNRSHPSHKSKNKLKPFISFNKMGISYSF